MSCRGKSLKAVKNIVVFTSIGFSLSTPLAVRAQQAGATLFENVRIFDGKSDALSGPTNVLIKANKIEKISAAPIAVDAAQTAGISGGGRVSGRGLLAHLTSSRVSAPARE